MENKKVVKILVNNLIFEVYACTIYHAIDKLYSQLYKIEKDRKKYKPIK